MSGPAIDWAESTRDAAPHVLASPRSMRPPCCQPPRIRGYRYRGATYAAGPCRKVVITKGMFTARCDGPQTSFSIDELTQGALGATPTTGGGDRRCVLFGGAVKADGPGLFVTTNAPPPDECP